MRVNRIATARESKGLSQGELGAKLGKSQQQIARYESGKYDLKGETLIALSNELDVSIEYLLGIDEWVSSDAAPADALTPDERELLALWRATTDEGRAMVMDAARSAARRLPLDPATGAQRRPA